MRQQYLIRLDDACPTMDHAKWQRMEDILDKYGIKPMVGVIPHNEDLKQQIEKEDVGFWEKVKSWEQKGWAIALHGYNHYYGSDKGLDGLNPIWAQSEFSGVPLDEQRRKIRLGVSIMGNKDITPRYFFAPSHTFDENTLSALREESSIRVISDTIATRPYRNGDFIFIPQFSGQCRKMLLPGLFTFCFHPNTMNDKDFLDLESFLDKHKTSFTSFDAIDLGKVRKKGLFDRLLSCAYFVLRKAK